MRFLVPFDVREPKTRLAAVLDESERHSFSRAMCADVLTAICSAGHEIELLATEPVGYDTVDPDPLTVAFEDQASRITTIVDDRPLTEAVNARLDEAADPLGIVMADMPLTRPETIDRLTSSGTAVTIAPGLGGGTNALVVRHSSFTVDYHHGSFQKHRRLAAQRDLSIDVVDSFRLAVDVDEPSDLVEVLLHGEGVAESWLREAGFRVETGGNRLTVTRSTNHH